MSAEGQEAPTQFERQANRPSHVLPWLLFTSCKYQSFLISLACPPVDSSSNTQSIPVHAAAGCLCVCVVIKQVDLRPYTAELERLLQVFTGDVNFQSLSFSINLLIIFSIHQIFVWSMKCQKVMKNSHYNFWKPKVTPILKTILNSPTAAIQDQHYKHCNSPFPLQEPTAG